jgi:hypothetical protein
VYPDCELTSPFLSFPFFQFRWLNNFTIIFDPKIVYMKYNKLEWYIINSLFLLIRLSQPVSCLRRRESIMAGNSLFCSHCFLYTLIICSSTFRNNPRLPFYKILENVTPFY